MRKNLLPIVVLAALLGCEQDPGPDDDGQQTEGERVESFNQDTTDEAYADVWSFDDGRRLILKDNTYMIVQGTTALEMGTVSSGSRAAARIPDANVGTLAMETTQIYASEYSFESVGELMDLSMLSAYTALPGFSPPAPPEIPDLDEWISEDELDDWYEESSTVYFEYQFEYIEEFYFQYTGMSLETLVPNWGSVLDQVMAANASPVAAGTSLFRELTLDYSIQEEESNKRVTMTSPSTTWECISSIPTDTLMWPDSFQD